MLKRIDDEMSEGEFNFSPHLFFSSQSVKERMKIISIEIFRMIFFYLYIDEHSHDDEKKWC